MERINTIIFSDVHLGSPMSRAYELLGALKEYRFSRLIINGDMFEDLNFEKLTSTHWELLEHIGKLSRRGVEVVWIEGNHDAKFITFMSHMIGIPVRREFVWELNDRRFIALHGHIFDSFISKNPFIGRFFAVAYAVFQRAISSHIFDFIMMKITDKWLRMTEQVARGALLYAKVKKCDVIICGHTHFVYNIKENGIEYFNLGCWNNRPSYLLAVSDDGSVKYKVKE